MKILTFLINERRYGISIEHIITVEKNERNITKIPKTNEIIIGVVNIRGKICPVLDLKLHLENTANTVDDTKKLILIEVNDNQVGLFIDDTDRIVDVDEENIETVETEKGVSKVVNQENDLFVLLEAVHIDELVRETLSLN